MAERVRARRLSDQEGQRLQQIVRRGRHGSIRMRRAMIIMASASGTPVPAIARLVAADEDTVRDVIHAFNEKGLAALDPRWAGGRPRLISDADIEVIVAAATTRPEKLGLPFTHWSLRKLSAYLARNRTRTVMIGRERLRQILHERRISFQRTRTWKESADPVSAYELACRAGYGLTCRGGQAVRLCSWLQGRASQSYGHLLPATGDSGVEAAGLVGAGGPLLGGLMPAVAVGASVVPDSGRQRLAWPVRVAIRVMAVRPSPSQALRRSASVAGVSSMSPEVPPPLCGPGLVVTVGPCRVRPPALPGGSGGQFRQ